MSVSTNNARVDVIVTARTKPLKRTENYVANAIQRPIVEYPSVLNGSQILGRKLPATPVRSAADADDWEPTSELTEKDMYDGSMGKELADLHSAKGHHDNAIAVLEQLLIKSPSNFIFRIKLAQSYALKGDHAMAITKWKELLEDHPWNPALRRILTDEYKLHNDVALELSGWLDLAERYPSVQQNQVSLLAAYEAQTQALASTEVVNSCFGSTAKLKIRSPYTLRSNSLFDTLYKYADVLYEHLDKLENSGFAVGLDILPDVSEMRLAEASNIAVFTGRVSSGKSRLLMSRRSGNAVGSIRSK